MRITRWIVLGVLSTCAAPALGQATIIVNDFWDPLVDPVGLTWSCEDYDFTNVQEAIDDAVDGDIILVCPGMYYPQDGADPATDAVAKVVAEESTLFIIGLDDVPMSGARPILNGSGSFPVVRSDISTSRFVMSNLQLSLGYAPEGDYDGGGVLCTAGAVSLTECTIGGFVGLGPGTNFALRGGGVFCADFATVSLTDCDVTMNFGLLEGGGVFMDRYADLFIDGGVISGNTAGIGGGISSHPQAFPPLDDPTTNDNPPLALCGNSASFHSDNIWGDYLYGDLICIATDCGNVGVECDCPNAGTPQDCNAVQDVIVVTDRAEDPDDWYSYHEIQEAIDTMAGPTDIIRVNPGTYGPVDFQGKKITIEALDPTPGVTIIDGSFAAYPPLQGVKTTSGETTAGTLRGFTIQNCYAGVDYGSEGGGVFAYRATPAIDQCMIRDNSAQSNFPGGGGIYSNYDAPVTITNCLFCQNTPHNVQGDIVDDGSNCMSLTCDDASGNGIPDECDTPGSDTWEVPSVETPSIQDAIDQAGIDDVIEIAAGTYFLEGEPITTYGKRLHLLAVDGPATTVIDGEGLSQLLLFQGGETAGMIVEGFTLTGGTGELGGAILMTASSPTIRNCRIRDNAASLAGGGMAVSFFSEPTIDLCDIDDNYGGQHGGGLYVAWRSAPIVTATTINNNRALYSGGGVSYEGYNLSLGYNLWNYGFALAQSGGTWDTCTFTQNLAYTYGGGVFAGQETDPVFTNCVFQSNGATWAGGAMFVLNPNDNAGPGDPPPSVLPSIGGSTFGCNDPGDINAFPFWPLWNDDGGNVYDVQCTVCPDVTGDLTVNTVDLYALIAAWGSDCQVCPEDINGDWRVDLTDLILMLDGWGMSCPG